MDYLKILAMVETKSIGTHFSMSLSAETIHNIAKMCKELKITHVNLNDLHVTLYNSVLPDLRVPNPLKEVTIDRVDGKINLASRMHGLFAMYFRSTMLENRRDQIEQYEHRAAHGKYLIRPRAKRYLHLSFAFTQGHDKPYMLDLLQKSWSFPIVLTHEVSKPNLLPFVVERIVNQPNVNIEDEAAANRRRLDNLRNKESFVDWHKKR